jgi:hypothetical protein
MYIYIYTCIHIEVLVTYPTGDVICYPFPCYPKLLLQLWFFFMRQDMRHRCAQGPRNQAGKTRARKVGASCATCKLLQLVGGCIRKVTLEYIGGIGDIGDIGVLRAPRNWTPLKYIAIFGSSWCWSVQNRSDISNKFQHTDSRQKRQFAGLVWTYGAPKSHGTSSFPPWYVLAIWRCTPFTDKSKHRMVADMYMYMYI